MLTDDTTGISSSSAGFGTEAGRVGAEPLRKIIGRENLSTILVRDRDLSCRNHPELFAGVVGPIGLIREFRKLSGTG